MAENLDINVVFTNPDDDSDEANSFDMIDLRVVGLRGASAEELIAKMKAAIIPVLQQYGDVEDFG